MVHDDEWLHPTATITNSTARRGVTSLATSLAVCSPTRAELA
ncbi:Hypothetical protein A7982_08583 [Minicystis rosea]|nr:Hypothetical protein A7982_08583 [Minicystis rosea]